MLDIKRIVADPEGTEAALKRRTPDASFAPILSLNTERREVVSRFNDLRHEQKTIFLIKLRDMVARYVSLYEIGIRPCRHRKSSKSAWP